ncbi:hypothetical protein [Treponema sp.]|uniref:hypothetical protein n=1 Tax=Treponema sp. TaxID=166 RepID=UPI00298E98AB|nr:hypothetical protein [Treponema sp.]MCQ2241140.1 hypothetical protein [Treponema sp.]
MSEQTNAIAAGRKTFFIQPDTSLLPENFCEEYLIDGFEAYFIGKIPNFSLENYIDYLYESFNDLILFFNIDSPPPNGETWSQFIRKINSKYEGKVLIGVLFTKRQNKDEKPVIEKVYLFDIGIMCGCIQLEYQKRNNFGIIEKVLYANQAMGRRKQVRALCNKNSTFDFVFNKNSYKGQLQDISLSHFSFVLPHGMLEIPLYERIDGIQMTIKGSHVRTSAVLFMNRPVNNGADDLFVFMFIQSSGAQGLEPVAMQAILPKIYEMLYENCMTLLKDKIATDQEQYKQDWAKTRRDFE